MSEQFLYDLKMLGWIAVIAIVASIAWNLTEMAMSFITMMVMFHV